MPHAPLRETAADVAGFLRFLARRIDEDRCQSSAAGLTWVTLFALVPLLTVFYTILSLVPEFQALGTRIEDLVFRHFVPATGAEIQRYLGAFTAQARTLTVPGTVMLFLSAWVMLRTIEESFNRIWRVRQPRRGLLRFALYWAILSLGPLLAGSALLLSSYLFSLGAADALPDGSPLRSALVQLLPEVFVFGVFLLLFVAVPNRRVPTGHAALGAALTTLVFEGGKAAFGWAVAQGNYGLVYGAFAALPLFLLWLYLSWLLLLTGAEFVYALAHYRSAREAVLPDALAALAVLERLHRAHQAGAVLGDAELLEARALAGHYRLHPEHWERLRRALLDARLLRSTQHGEYVLGTDAAQVPLWELARLFGWPRLDAMPDPETMPRWLARAARALQGAESALRATLEERLDTLFDAEHRTDAHAP